MYILERYTDEQIILTAPDGTVCRIVVTECRKNRVKLGFVAPHWHIERVELGHLEAESEKISLPEEDKVITEKISRKVFESLPEYSCSQPTGVILGKVWKARPNDYPHFWMRDKEWNEIRKHEWIICEYVKSSTPNCCDVELRIPNIVEEIK